MKRRLEKVDLAGQKWPEVIEVVDEFRRMASGKVRKVDMRDQLRAAAKK